MALDESALSELLDALRAGEGTDQVRTLAQWALQQLIELEATEKIGAGRYERSDARVTERNGHRPRVVSTLTDGGHRWPTAHEHAARRSVRAMRMVDDCDDLVPAP